MPTCGATPTSSGWTGNGSLADLDGRTVWQRVQADADSALASGARGTPTLFINGRRHLAGYDQSTLRAALHAATKET